MYDANTDRNSVIVNELIRPIKARFVRIYPVSWHGHMSMRMEFMAVRSIQVTANRLIWVVSSNK